MGAKPYHSLFLQGSNLGKSAQTRASTLKSRRRMVRYSMTQVFKITLRSKINGGVRGLSTREVFSCICISYSLIDFGSAMNQSIQKSMLTLTLIPMNFIGPAESILLRPAITTASTLDISKNHNLLFKPTQSSPLEPLIRPDQACTAI